MENAGSPQGTAIFLTTFFALASVFILVRHRSQITQRTTVIGVSKNIKIAGRKSITTFINKIDKKNCNFFINPQSLELGRVVGIGSHGVVYEGLYQGKDVAVKELIIEPDENIAKDSRERFLQEMIALYNLHHPNIIKFIGLGALDSMITMNRTYFFVMELASFSLRDILQDDMLRVKISSLQKVLDFGKQISLAVAYIHAMGLM